MTPQSDDRRAPNLATHFPRSTVTDPACVECGGVWPCEGGERDT